MAVSERIAALIGNLYDCVIAPDQWEACLNTLRTELNFANESWRRTRSPPAKRQSRCASALRLSGLRGCPDMAPTP